MLDFEELADRSIKNKGIDQSQALQVIQSPDQDIFFFLAVTNRVRLHFFGNKVKLCAIVNAKSGKCSENCSFCAQSTHYKTNVATYPLLSQQEMVTAAKEAEAKMSATCFSIVTSGKTIHTDQEVETIGRSISTIKQETRLNRCVSLGTLSKEQIKRLKESGISRLHHNLETAESFFPKMCTTHTYRERLETIRLAKEAGIEVCSGGIFGLGETLEQRVELAFALKELDVQSVPINILNPIAGTPAAKNPQPITPFDVLRLVATYRLILPTQDIGVFGGRERALGSLQPLMFAAGANVTLVGDYLTTKGQPPEKDLQMIRELGLEVITN